MSNSSGARFTDAMQKRLIDFAVTIIQLADQLPSTRAGKYIAGQILQCGTSPAPQYGKNLSTKSLLLSTARVNIVHRELNETCVWLRIIHLAKLIAGELIESALNECDQLCRIVGKSIATANDRENPLNDGRRRR